MKKKVLSFFILSFLTLMSVNAQSVKIKVTESAFVQGGETASETFGVTKPESLLVFNSKTNTKYSRITFLKFKLPQKLEKVKLAEITLKIKVFKDKVASDLKFDLDVQAVSDEEWSSQSITFNNAPKLGAILGSAKVSQSLDNIKLEQVTIKLDVEAINALIKESKKGIISIALANNVSGTFGASIGKDSFLTVE